MRLIKREHLQRWADTTFSKEALPYVISRLIRATSPKSTRANIPWGSATYIGGWDGIVTCESDASHVPQGISLWEFGTNSNINGKADGDYSKRKGEPLGFEPKECVFIFVTPRLWTGKNNWVAEKKAENHWKDVIAYDSVDLEQWLDNALSVSRWFAAQDGVGAYPFDGIMTADESWEEWSYGLDGIQLAPQTIIAGREFQKNKLLETLMGPPSIKGVKASTKDEAIAFIIACAKTFEDEHAQEFFSKALVVDTEGNFRGIRINTVSPLNLIPRFENYQPLYSAVGRGHHVIVPLGADDDFNQETITLPTIDRDGQVDALIKSGVAKNDAEKFSRESGRNITILKKLLGFPHSKTKWLEEENIREIIPALLLGRWNETFVGDIELLEKLSGQKYEDYRVTLNKWKNLEEAPILQIGETWRLTSPLDIWTNLASQLTQRDFKKLEECFALSLKGGNPIAKPEDESFAARFNQKRTFSGWSREGLIQSLILVARLGDSLEIPNLGNPERWVDSIISDLLRDAKGELWISIDHELPLISEASPNSFLKSVKNSLNREEPEIMELFKEVDGFFYKNSHHTGLLWALEGLAWSPDYLRDVGLILLKLARLDPGGNLSNRPINSIVEIFKPWHYQTLASYEERMLILKQVTKQEKETGWTLLTRMLPDSHSIGQPTHKMRWRMFDMNTNIVPTYKEIWDTHTSVIEMLIDLFDYDEKKFAQLIQATTELGPIDRARVLDWADEVYLDVNQKDFTTWKVLRTILHRHRSHPDTDWALPEQVLGHFEKLYEKLEPKSIVERNIWLFDNHWPEFPDVIKHEDAKSESWHDQQQKRIDSVRKEAVERLINEIGLEETLSLRKKVKEFWVFGDAFAKVNLSRDDIVVVCGSLYDKAPNIGFIHSFLYRKSVLEGFDWIKTLFNKLKEKGFSNDALTNVLIPLDQNQKLWNYISAQSNEVQNNYWENVHSRFLHGTTEEKEYAITKLLEFKRFISAIDAAYLKPENVSSKLLVQVLERAATEKTNEKAKFKGYEVERIFEELDRRNDLEKSKLIQLEWHYLALLGSYSSRRNPKNLEEELANNPSFFIDVLKWLYLPKNKDLLEEERKDVSEDTVKSMGKQSYQLLKSWKKIPGMKEDNSIDKGELSNWIETVRQLALKVDRLEVADAEIGKLLAQYPENVPEWPQKIIFQILEGINTDSLKRNYSSAMFNKRSFSSRGAFDGGDIERKKAAYFSDLASKTKVDYPNVSEIFYNMAKSYLHDAKQMDDDAERNKLEY